jgi:hypothetical protein
MRPEAPDHATLLRWAPVLPHVTGLWTSPPHTGGLQRCHASRGSESHPASAVGSITATCPMASDPTSMPKGAPVLPLIHGSLWTMGIKKGLLVLGVQRGTHVTEAHPRITEVPAKCMSGRRYHDLQDVRTCGYSTTLQCSTAWLTSLRHGLQGP